MMLNAQRPNDCMRVDLGSGAALYLRPLTPSVFADVQGRCSDKIERLVAGDLGTVRELGPLAPEFRQIERTAEWVARATFLIFPLELVLSTATCWEGVADENGVPLTVPTPKYLIKLLRDPDILVRVQVALGSQIDRILNYRPGDANG